MDVLEQLGIQRWRYRGEILNESLDVPPAPKPQEEPVQEHQPDAPVLADQTSPVRENHEEPPGDLPRSEPGPESLPKPAADEPKTADRMDWGELEALLQSPDYCPSCAVSRPVLGEGDRTADWMFIVDAPTTRDIEQQQLLTGRAGQLFDAILHALGHSRDQVYISSVFKCPPVQELNVSPQCDKLILRQVALVQPCMLVAFGEFAAQTMIKANEDLAALRAAPRRCPINDLPIIPTFSLTEMLADPGNKAHVWEDLKSGMRLLES